MKACPRKNKEIKNKESQMSHKLQSQLIEYKQHCVAGLIKLNLDLIFQFSHVVFIVTYFLFLMYFSHLLLYVCTSVLMCSCTCACMCCMCVCMHVFMHECACAYSSVYVFVVCECMSVWACQYVCMSVHSYRLMHAMEKVWSGEGYLLEPVLPFKFNFIPSFSIIQLLTASWNACYS